METHELVRHFSTNLAISAILVIITTSIHFVGLSVLTILLRSPEWENAISKRASVGRRYFSTLLVVFGLFIVHTIEIWIYAFVYRFLFHAFADFEQALYFSTISFVSLGNGDVLLPREWRIVGAIEAANGVILLGWSTAFFITVVARLRVLEHEWLEQFRTKPKQDEEN